ncbi:hypothetical protein EJ110_NYTH21073 [Nymphaea thermarum]|nr:hypothetical protein EJ110_NYTH21073 [Nymphaea thermarum]
MFFFPRSIVLITIGRGTRAPLLQAAVVRSRLLSPSFTLLPAACDCYWPQQLCPLSFVATVAHQQSAHSPWLSLARPVAVGRLSSSPYRQSLFSPTLTSTGLPFAPSDC